MWEQKNITIDEVLESIPISIRTTFIPVSFKKGDIITKEGDKVSYGYIITEGSFDVIKSDLNDRAYIVSHNHAGGFICMMDIYSNILIQCATIKTTSSVRGYKIPITQCYKLLDTPCLFQSYIIKVWAKQFYYTSNENRNFPIYSYRYKLLKFLISNSSRKGDTLTLSITRDGLISIIGCSRRTLFRLISKLKEENLITLGRKSVSISHEQEMRILQELEDRK